MDEVSLNTDAVGDDETAFVIEGDCAMTECVGQSGEIQGKNVLPPAIGMEFESYEDVYYFYNCFAREHGFGVRVSNTWYTKSKERYRGKLSCSSAGFKKKSEAHRPRPETRTGCPAMIKFRLMENKRWRIIEVELEHNHLISPASGRFYKSHKHTGPGSKRMLQLDDHEEVEKVRLFRTVIIDAQGSGDIGVFGEELRDMPTHCNRLKLKRGDAQALHNYFCRSQLMDPNFFYVIDLNDKACLRNLFWIDARSRVAYCYFGDVVLIDNTCLTNKYEVPIVSFTGVNHHGQPLPLGCGMVAGETVESYTWLLRAWLTCMLGRPPQTIISDQCRTLETAVADVFPRASHCLCLSQIMKKVPERLGGLFEFENIRMALNRVACYSLRADEFEAAWDDMVQHYGIREHEWIQALYEERKRWAPAYLKETSLVGKFPTLSNEVVSSFFEGYIDKHTSLKEFLDKYVQALHNSLKLEDLADIDSRNCGLSLKSRCHFELQLSKLYTNEILRKFQKEVEGMYSCFSIGKMHAEGPIVTFIVREEVEVEGIGREMKDFEVFFNANEMDILCVCGLFNLRGYLCRHALSVLNQNGVQDIPAHYILYRWRKDIKRRYILDHKNGGINISNPVHRYDYLQKCIMTVVEEGRKSQDCYKDTLRALNEILQKLELVEN